MKSTQQSDTSIVWPAILALGLLGMLAFMIVADPAAERAVTNTAQSLHGRSIEIGGLLYFYLTPHAGTKVGSLPDKSRIHSPLTAKSLVASG